MMCHYYMRKCQWIETFSCQISPKQKTEQLCCQHTEAWSIPCSVVSVRLIRNNTHDVSRVQHVPQATSKPEGSASPDDSMFYLMFYLLSAQSCCFLTALILQINILFLVCVLPPSSLSFPVPWLHCRWQICIPLYAETSPWHLRLAR